MPPLFFQLVLPNDALTKAMKPILDQVQNDGNYHRPVTGGSSLSTTRLSTHPCKPTAIRIGLIYQWYHAMILIVESQFLRCTDDSGDRRPRRSRSCAWAPQTGVRRVSLESVRGPDQWLHRDSAEARNPMGGEPEVEFGTISFHLHRRFKTLDTHLEASGFAPQAIIDGSRSLRKSGERSA